jgi:hypothetical protein
MTDLHSSVRPEIMRHREPEFEATNLDKMRADLHGVMRTVTQVSKTIGPKGATLLNFVGDVVGDVVRQFRAEITNQFAHQLKETRAWFEEQLGFLETKIRALPAGRDGLPGCPGPPGRDGAPGRDGMGIDDLEMDFDGERRVVFKFVSGERVKQFPPIIMPSLIDRGVYKPGWYERGDAVSFGGSLWIAQIKTNGKPGADTAAWRLAVKHGRDGRDGKDGARGERGPEGRPGRDLTLG